MQGFGAIFDQSAIISRDFEVASGRQNPEMALFGTQSTVAGNHVSDLG